MSAGIFCRWSQRPRSRGNFESCGRKLVAGFKDFSEGMERKRVRRMGEKGADEINVYYKSDTLGKERRE